MVFDEVRPAETSAHAEEKRSDHKDMPLPPEAHIPQLLSHLPLSLDHHRKGEKAEDTALEEAVRAFRVL